MNINFDKFWEWLQKWSVGKIIVTLSLLTILLRGCSEYPRSLNYFIALGVFLQIFDFCDNDLTSNEKKDISKIQMVVLNFFMLISVLVLIAITYKLLQI
jgi:hypothetical protein